LPLTIERAITLVEAPTFASEHVLERRHLQRALRDDITALGTTRRFTPTSA
jgi:hypothetical protein